MFKEQKGITLVALVITIIVLLILAGVSISLVLGDNGVLTQATGAVAKNQVATVKEKVSTAFAAVDVAYYSEWASNQSVERKDVYKDATTGIEAELGRNTITTTGSVEDKGGNTISVSIDADGYVGTAKPLIVMYEGTVYNFGDVVVDATTGKLTFNSSEILVTEPGKETKTVKF